MGTFRVTAIVSNLHDRSRRQTVGLLVDTGATYTTLPGEVVQALGCSPVGRRRVQLADGREEEWAVATVLIERDRAVGVRLESGEEVRARVVLANTDPRRTFLGLVGAERLDPAFAADIEAYRCESATFRMNLALDGVPEFACRPGPGLDVHHRCFMALTPSYAAFEDAYRAASAGESLYLAQLR